MDAARLHTYQGVADHERRRGPFAGGGGHMFSAAGPHIAGGEESRHTGFENHRVEGL